MRPPTVRLGDVATIQREIVEPADIRSGTIYVGLEHIESGGRFVNVGPVAAGELASSKFAFTPQHVLYGKLRPYLAKVARPNFSGVCSTDILPLLPTSRLDPGYLRWLLLTPSMVSRANNLATGANLPRLSPAALLDLSIPLPPLADQRRIANILDRADALRGKRRAALAQLDRVADAIYTEMFGDSTSPSADWPQKELAQLCVDRDDIKCGPFGTQLSKSEFTDAGVPLWGIRDLNTNFALPPREFVSARTAARLHAYSLQPGDIVMTRKGAVGNCSLFPVSLEPGVMHSDVVRLRLAPTECDSQFVRHQLQHSAVVAHQMSLISGGAIMPGVNVTKLKSLKVLVPPLKLQREFATRVERVNYIRIAQGRARRCLDALVASLQHRAFRGQL